MIEKRELQIMNIKINVELKERLEKIYSEVFELIGSKEFNDERDKCVKLIWNEDVELSEEEEKYCLLFNLLFNLENVKEFIRDVE